MPSGFQNITTVCKPKAAATASLPTSSAPPSKGTATSSKANTSHSQKTHKSTVKKSHTPRNTDVSSSESEEEPVARAIPKPRPKRRAPARIQPEDEDEEPAPRPKKRKANHSSDLLPPDNTDELALSTGNMVERPRADGEQEVRDKPKGVRTTATVEYDPDIVRQYEMVHQSPLQSTRIEHGVEYLYQAARFLPRILGPHVDYDIVLLKGLSKVGKYDPSDPEIQERLWGLYWEVRFSINRINDTLPGFEDHNAYFRLRPDLVPKLAKWMTAVSGKSRSDDLNRIKGAILSFAKINDTGAVREKTSRGFKNIYTARQLCPIKMLDKFDENPEEFCRLVRDMNGDRPRVTAFNWPSFLYDQNLYVPGKSKGGFFKSQILLKCVQCIFTGPASADADAGTMIKSKGKPSIARKMPSQSMSIMTIVYVATLARFALNSQKDWQDRDGDFVGPDFVRAVMTGFLRDEAWNTEVLEWYRRRVFDRNDEDLDDLDNGEPTAYDDLLAEIEEDGGSLQVESELSPPPMQRKPSSESTDGTQDPPPLPEHAMDGIGAESNPDPEA